LWRASRARIGGRPEYKLYLPILSADGYMHDALEFSSSYNAANLFLFFGTYNNDNTITYYKMYTKQDDFAYENDLSIVNYDLSHSIT